VPEFEARQEQSRLALREAAIAFSKLRARFPSCSIMSTSGTGTFQADLAIPEVTEIQPGSYVFMDSEYRAIGSAGDPNRFLDFEPGLRILTTVVSAHHDGFVTIDAGLKALYRDGGMPEVFGDLADRLHYDWFGDEFGRITCDTPDSRPPIGSQIQLIPSHCDPTVNLYDHYLLYREGTITGTWPIELKRQES
jgi:D-serine deaminase-like pyridoxal phosphate-dependent protein